ncbi:hypothetical protein OCS_01803 [Ophiocordyceps sinensis CO18]|uniref:Uncharacterized protein n=1 Tax=Ophiocordyceps sinensis (strain Co18 / CGMCC 3.14243) TaxID=911162 RepID=T5AL39_OPHSC|nr:hypothetical protein OCS_01803 [Ophiocordyceps sinensis CO18]
MMGHGVLVRAGGRVVALVAAAKDAGKGAQADEEAGRRDLPGPCLAQRGHHGAPWRPGRRPGWAPESTWSAAPPGPPPGPRRRHRPRSTGGGPRAGRRGGPYCGPVRRGRRPGDRCRKRRAGAPAEGDDVSGRKGQQQLAQMLAGLDPAEVGLDLRRRVGRGWRGGPEDAGADQGHCLSERLSHEVWSLLLNHETRFDVDVLPVPVSVYMVV